MNTCFSLGLVLMIGGGLMAPVHSSELSAQLTSQPLENSNSLPGLISEDDLYRYYSTDTDENYVEPMFFFEPEKHIQFELFTMNNRKEPQYIELENLTSLTQSNFNKNNPTRIFIHGWLPSGSFTTEFPDAYFEKGNHQVNYIAVNWKVGASTKNYHEARARIDTVAEYTAKLIEFLVKSGGMRFKDLVVIGFSLGAHTAGIVGKKVTDGRIPKIIGLDPASYLFYLYKPDERLAETDADIVEVIHTNTDRFGFKEPLGTIDYYPNGGKAQPGCYWSIGASHTRSYELFLESLYNPDFFAIKCDSFEHAQENKCTADGPYEVRKMGGEPGDYVMTKGAFYLKTGKDKPFALGLDGITLTQKSKLAILKDKFQNWKKSMSSKLFNKVFKGKTSEMESKSSGNSVAYKIG